MPPRLDLAADARQTAERMRSPLRLAAARQDRQAGERRKPRALFPRARGAHLGAEELHRPAVQHPVRIDASDALHRRLSGRGEMALRLFALQLSLRLPVVRRTDCSPSARARRRRRLPPPERECGPHQARDRPSRATRRGCRRQADPQRQGRAAATLPPFKMPVSANSPCKVVPPATPIRRPRPATAPIASTPPISRRLPGGPSYTVLDQVEHGPADDFGPVRVPRRPRVPDGRQSRRQPRQPLFGSRGRHRHGPAGRSDRPRARHLLVDRRQRVLLEAVDLVYARSARTASATAIREEPSEGGRRRPSCARRSDTSRRTFACSSLR